MKLSILTVMANTACLASTFLVRGTNGFSSQAAGATSSQSFSSLPALSAFDYNKNSRLPYVEDGYGTWKWRDHDINYLELGDPSKPPILLIHGFGASCYHWRNNVPDLAKDYHVYAFDMLGFGGSSKPIQDYGAEVWRDQTLDFIEQVIQRPTTVAGNSLGGFTALYAASDDRGKELITGCISLNGAGRFRDPTAPTQVTEKNVFMEGIMTAMQRLVIGASFIYTKQPARIEQVLKQVYPIDNSPVDEELVRSIQTPSFHPNAAEVFYRVITKNGAGPSVTVDDCLEKLECPLLLCWGEEDPWIRSASADKMQALYPSAKRVSIDAGHCPHDENPGQVNAAIREFVNEINNNVNKG
jgi:pimeloyl-ACP methyl ester carboxylesterase